MKIDTDIRHVSKPGANLFSEMGFPPEDAERLHQASQQQIKDARLKLSSSLLMRWSKC